MAFWRPAFKNGPLHRWSRLIIKNTHYPVGHNLITFYTYISDCGIEKEGIELKQSVEDLRLCQKCTLLYKQKVRK